MLRPNLIRAVAAFVKEKPDIDRAIMIAALGEIAVDKLQSDARAYVGISGGSMQKAYVRVLEKKYNAMKSGAVKKA